MYRSFEEIPVWKKALDLAQQIFALTEGLPKKEDYGLTSQIRRSALSASGNLARGFGRHHTKDKMNFYYASRGSLTETKSHLIYAQRVGYLKRDDHRLALNLIDDIWKELNGLIHSLRNKTYPQP
ncbi:MAG: four helix bundle protein [Nitrospira sp.]|nr:four helix bundle protein [Nitrospira sp.]